MPWGGGNDDFTCSFNGLWVFFKAPHPILCSPSSQSCTCVKLSLKWPLCQSAVQDGGRSRRDSLQLRLCLLNHSTANMQLIYQKCPACCIRRSTQHQHRWLPRHLYSVRASFVSKNSSIGQISVSSAYVTSLALTEIFAKLESGTPIQSCVEGSF